MAPALGIGIREVLACEEAFFAALLAADHDRLGAILAGDVVIIGVLSGQVARGGDCSARSAPGSCGSPRWAGGNGRALDDDAFDIAVAVLAGSMLGNASVPRPPTAEFPYLAAPSPAELPALADLFGLREHRPE